MTALNDVSFAIDKGEFVFVVGASGSGKSTMIRLLLARRSSNNVGRILVGGRDLDRLKHSKVPLLRRNLGCVFQDFKLLPNRTAAENVAYALKVQGESSASIRRKVPEVLSLVGLSDKTSSLPDGLSGGEQRRRLDRARRRQPSSAPDLRRADREPRPRYVRRDRRCSTGSTARGRRS